MMQAPYYDSIYFKHVPAKIMKSMLGSAYDKYFKFAFVRNPWDWIVSNYAYNRGLHKPFVKGTKYQGSPKVPDWAKDMSFSEWLRWWVESFSPSQSEMLVDDEGNLLMDEIYRFESLKKDAGRLNRKLRIWTLGSLPHRESSKRKANYKDYYDPETIEYVQEYFSTDLKMFGYPMKP